MVFSLGLNKFCTAPKKKHETRKFSQIKSLVKFAFFHPPINIIWFVVANSMHHVISFFLFLYHKCFAIKWLISFSQRANQLMQIESRNSQLVKSNLNGISMRWKSFTLLVCHAIYVLCKINATMRPIQPNRRNLVLRDMHISRCMTFEIHL